MKQGDFPTSQAKTEDRRVKLPPPEKKSNGETVPAILQNAHPKREYSMHNFQLLPDPCPGE
jgi:hypothetical protein